MITEADTCRKYLLPKLYAGGWNDDQINEQKSFTDGGTARPARYGRMGKAKTYDLKQQRQGRYYDQKKVEVFYTIEGDVIVTVTVYVFYGKWGGNADSL